MSTSGAIRVATYYATKRRKQVRQERYEKYHKIALSANTVPVAATVGTVIGAFTTQDAAAPIVYTIDVDGAAGKFSINGSQLRVADALTLGSYALQIKATDANSKVCTTGFLIKVI